MRKQSSLLIAFLLFSTIIVSGCSQRQNEHMKFMDISMGQSIDKFTDALMGKGFKHIAQENGLAIMEGEFSGSPVQVAIFETSKKGCVAMIMVEFPTEADKSKARNLYDKYGKLLDKKYTGCFRGKNSQYFQHLIENPDVDQISDRSGVTLGDYMTYFASWKVSKGEIAMRIYNTSHF